MSRAPERRYGGGEKKMRVIALLFLFGTLSEFAIAQSSLCRFVPKASDRLVCYDKATPPTAADKPAKSKTATPADAPAQTIDMLAVENSKLDARLKTICRGC
jgi:hypothetical protein